MSLERFIQRLPKAELHVHLEGAMSPRTLLDLARRRGVELPADTPEGLAEWFRFRDFDHFVEIYLLCSSCLQQPEDFQRLVLDFLGEQARQNVGWSEVHFSIGTHASNGVNPGEVADAMWEAMEEGARRFGTEMRLIPDIVRNAPWKWADLTVEWALDGREKGVIALGMAGIEAEGTDLAFRSHFEAAREEGLARVVHAGEQLGPESIWSVLDVCTPDRLDHGVRAIEDERLLRRLRETQLPLDVCPTSNVVLGYFPDLESHPFGRLREEGLAVNLGSDDPPLFETTLTREYLAVAATFGYEAEDLVDLASASIEAAFLPEARKARLRTELRNEALLAAVEELGRELESPKQRAEASR